MHKGTWAALLSACAVGLALAPYAHADEPDPAPNPAPNPAPRWRKPAPGAVHLGLGFPTVGELGIGIRGASALEIEASAAAIATAHKPGVYGLLGLNADLARWSMGTSVLIAGLRGGRTLLSVPSCSDTAPQQCSPHEGWLVEAGLGYAYRFPWGAWRVHGFAQVIFWDEPDQYDAARRAFASYDPRLVTLDPGVRTTVAFGIW